MRSRSRSTDGPVHRISGPSELLAAVPYLLGFHPHDSLVLVGMHERRVVVTARLDLADVEQHGALEHAIGSMARGGAGSVIAVAYPATRAGHDWSGLTRRLLVVAEECRCALSDALLVHDGRWWSLVCDGDCCPAEGRALEHATSAFEAFATFEGMVALSDRSALVRLLEPAPEDERARLEEPIALEQRAAVRAVLRGEHQRRERGVKRALFAAARASVAPRWRPPGDNELARFGVALAATTFRDAAWLAVDDGRLDGRPLWLELARRLPSPHELAPLLLFGWSAWRAGEAAVAGMAADRALAVDPQYTAADLLLAAVTSGINPHAMPRLRRPA